MDFLHSPFNVSDDHQPAPFWPIFAALAAPFVVALVVHFLIR